MNEEQEKLLAIYRDLWTELNAVNVLRDELANKAREIHARQRQLANKIARLSIPSEGEA